MKVEPLSLQDTSRSTIVFFDLPEWKNMSVVQYGRDYD